MGISNLNKFLRNNCPEVYEYIHISEYSFKKVAIDISLYLCKYKIVCGDRWLTAFINLVACLRKNEIHCVFIYDSGAPPDKAAERAERAEHRDKIEQKVYLLEEAMEKFHMTGEVDPILIELNKKGDQKTPQRLLGRIKNETINMGEIEAKIEKMRSYILDISPQDFALTKQLFTLLEVPYYDAPLEAETMCADLCKRGLVDAVLSEDTDVIAYDSPVFLSKIDTTNETCIRVCPSAIKEALELETSELLDLCIMCGTDYNKNIFRVGPEKAYKYLLQHRTIEGIADNTPLDISILKHTRVRELFTEYEQYQLESVPYCGTPNFQSLKDFVFKHNIHLDVDGLRKAFVHDVLIFEEDE